MKLTNEQLAKCKSDFEKKFPKSRRFLDDDNRYLGDYGALFIGFQAAWRPIPSMKEIEEIICDHVSYEQFADYGQLTGRSEAAQAVYRKLGGKE